MTDAETDSRPVDRTVEQLSNDRDVLAETTVNVANEIYNGLIEDPQSLIDYKDTVELALRNPAVLGDRITTGTDISGVSERQREEMAHLEQKARGVLIACGVDHGRDKDSGGTDDEPLHLLQTAVLKGDLPVQAAGMVANMLKDSTIWFSSVMADTSVSVDSSLQRYCAGNTKATMSSHYGSQFK